MSQTGGQAFRDTSPCEVSEYSLVVTHVCATAGGKIIQTNDGRTGV